MSIPVTCPACATRIPAPTRAAGKAVRCPQCQAVVPVPHPAKAETAVHRPTDIKAVKPRSPGKATSAAAPRPAPPRRHKPGSGRMMIVVIAVAAVALIGGSLWLLYDKPALPRTENVDDAPASTTAASSATPAGPAVPAAAPSIPSGEPPISTVPSALPAAVRAVAVAPGRVAEQRLLFAGSRGTTRFRCALILANGEVLIGGSSDDLAWTGDAPRTAWSATLPGGSGAKLPFVLHLSADLTSIHRVYHLPKGSLQEIQQLRSTALPGQDGIIYASGGCEGLEPKVDGYVILRLDGDAVAGSLKPSWATFVKAPARQAGGYTGEGGYKETQRWDVRNDGMVIAASGCDFDFGWAELQLIDARGAAGTMAEWTTKEGRSFLALKAGSDAGLRSKTQADFDLRQEDDNGNPGRKGRWPDDYYFKGPGQGGPGYTGYRTSNKPTQRVGTFAIDRRNNHLYFGYSTQTKLPGGNPDFEPAIVAMDDKGGLKWWARGYKEIERTGENEKQHGDAINSPPDQYIDHVAIDYTSDKLIVVARCHGNGVINYWAGHEIRRNTGRPGFQQRFTGKNGNIHISWLGRYGLNDGKVWNATYLAEFNEGAKVGKPFTSGQLAGWPNPNEGWADVNTTRTSALAIDHLGRPAVLGIGRRPFTTSDALIPNRRPDQGVSAWAPFARVYDQDLGAISYSTIVRGPWDPVTGSNAGDDIDLEAVVPLSDGLLIVGTHTVGKDGGVSDLPATGVPAWAAKRPPGSTSSGLITVVRIPASGTP